MPRVCVVGGGPAGMMTGLLLARAGIETVVLEKHKDFFRDFRGDTLHPSTLELMSELGFLEACLKVPHDEMRKIQATMAGETFTIADVTTLPTVCKFVAMMPQWDFLTFIANEAARYPMFQLRMEAEAVDLIFQGDAVVGVRIKTPEGEAEILAELVIGADGRHSIVRDKAGLDVQDFGAPIDVLWTRIPKDPNVSHFSLGYFDAGKFMVLIDRGDYFQCGYIIPKGAFDQIRERGLDAFRNDIVGLAPFVEDHIRELDDWDQVKLLTVQIDRLRTWARSGLLCIGDSAHAMSPAGGVGINLAIQDAVATANILSPELRKGSITQCDLLKVQTRRELPTRLTQSLQVAMHKRILTASTESGQRDALKAPMWFLKHVPGIPKVIARVIGLGFRREHIQSADVSPR